MGLRYKMPRIPNSIMINDHHPNIPILFHEIAMHAKKVHEVHADILRSG